MAQIDVLASAIARRISSQLRLASRAPRRLESVAAARPLWSVPNRRMESIAARRMDSAATRRMESIATRRFESVVTRRFDSVIGPTMPGIDVEELASAVLRRLRGV
jgi:hypothetical protein